MERRVLVILLLGAAVLAAGGAFFVLTRSRPEPAPAPTIEAPKPAPVVKAPPPAPEPEAAPAPAPRRRAAPRPAAEPVEAPPETATLTIDSDVPGATVFLDREYIGTTPVTVRDVKPGTHRINASVAGYEGVVETVEAAVGPADVLLRFREVRLSAALDVVHKHRMGSCKGRIVATPQGLRYETANKDDAFASGLLDLETFEIDYLEKNLRVKPRKGKTYNFTDPQENADRLFVFHRDVQKARDRLAKGDPPAKQ